MDLQKKTHPLDRPVPNHEVISWLRSQQTGIFKMLELVEEVREIASNNYDLATGELWNRAASASFTNDGRVPAPWGRVPSDAFSLIDQIYALEVQMKDNLAFLLTEQVVRSALAKGGAA